MIDFSNYIKCKDEKDVLREKYLHEDIFLVGTKIINGDRIGEIIRRGPNYVIALDENQKVFRSWITNIKEYVEEKPKRINKYRNYNNSRDNMNSVQSTAFFLGMLPEHSYKIRRAVERTILERMDYDTAVETISEDLKSDFLTNKAVEYLDIVIAEADQEMIAAKKQMQQQKDQMQKQAMQQKLQLQKQELQNRMQKQSQKASQMKEEEEIDEAEKWIQKAIKHKGALHKQLGVPAGEKIPAGKLEKAAHAKGKLGKRARLAQTLAGLHKEESDYDWSKHSHFEHGQHAAKEELKTGKKAEPYHTPGSKADKEWRRGYNSVMKKEEVEIDEAGAFLRRAKRSRINPNELRVQAARGSRLAKSIRAEKGLGEEEIHEEDPCWKGYKQVGMKKKGGKEVPNCTPVGEELKGGQHKIDVAPPYGKLTGADFKKLRASKKSMKEQEQVGGVSSGFGFQGVYGASGKKYRKEEFSDWRNEISLSENLVEKVVKGNVIINPSTNDCPNCGERLDKTSTCPNCDTNELRTRYHEENYEIIEKHLSAAEAKKKEEIVKSMKKGISGFKKRYGERAKEVMYATATKQAKKVAEEIDALDEAEERFGVYDRKKGSFVQTGISQQSAKALYQRLVKGGGRSSKEITIRKVKY